MLKLTRAAVGSLFLATGAALANPLPVAAQSKPGGQHTAQANGGAGAAKAQNPQAVLDTMTRNLGLTQDQQARIRPVLEQMFKDVRATVNDPAVPQEAKAKKVLSIRSAAHEKIAAGLNPQQREKFRMAVAQLKDAGHQGAHTTPKSR